MARVKANNRKKAVKSVKSEKSTSNIVKSNLKSNAAVSTSPKAKFSFKDLKSKKWFMAIVYVLIVVLALGLIDFMVQYLNNGYSMAVVNGVRLSKSEYYSRLDKAYGTQASGALIDEELILQEGAKQKIEVTQGDIDGKINEIKASLGGDKPFEDALKANNINLRDLQRQVKLQIITTKILEPTIKYSEQEVKDFFNQYKAVLYTADAKYEDKKADVTNQFLSKKVEDAKTTWLTTLRTQAKIQNNITAAPSYGLFKTSGNVLMNAWNSIQNMRK